MHSKPSVPRAWSARGIFVLWLFAASLARAQTHPTYTWTGAGGDNQWGNPANWNPSAVPPAEAIAAINSGSPDASSLGNGSLYGVNLSGGALTCAGLTVQVFNQNGGTLAGNSTVSGAFTWTAGNWNSTGTLTIAAGAALSITSGANHDLARHTLVNFGTVVWTGGRIRGGGTGGSHIQNHGLWDVQCDNAINNDYPGEGLRIENDGLFQKSAGSGTTTVAVFLSNSGTLKVHNGTLALNNGAALNDGSRYVGAGTVSLAAGTFSVSGTLVSSNLVQNGGTLAGSHSISGVFTWNAGNWNSVGTATVLSSATLLIASGNDHDLARHTLVNDGTVVWTGGRIRGGGTGGSRIQNLALWDVQCDYALNSDYLGDGLSFDNQGLFQKSAGSGVTAVSAALSNSGTIDLRDGTLVLYDGATLNDGSRHVGPGTVSLASGTFTANGTVVSSNLVQTGGTWAGDQTISGVFTWYAGNWNSVGTTTLASNSVLNIASGNDHDLPGHTFTNFGTVIWTGGRVRGGGSAGSAIQNLGLWEAQCDSHVNGDYAGKGLTFNNLGTFRKSAGGGATSFDNSAPFYNTGAVDLQSGALAFNGRGGARGSFTLGKDLTITFGDGYTFTDEASFPGPGKIVFSGGTITLNGSFAFASLLQMGGTLAGNHTLAGTVTWQSGNWNSVGTTTLASNSVLNITSGNDHDLPGHTFTNYGTVVWTGGRVRGGGSAGSAIQNLGLWEAQCDYHVNGDYAGKGLTFNNLGTFRKSAGGGATSFDNSTPFYNTGAVDLRSGALAFNGGGGARGSFAPGKDLTITFGDGYTFTDEASFPGPGKIVFSGGTITLNGSFAFASLLQMGGTLAGNHTLAGTVTWQSGNWNSVGTTTLASNATLNIVSGNDHDLPRRTLINYGTVVWSGGHVRGGYEGTLIQNYGLWDCQTEYTINSAYGGNGLTFSNLGLFRKSAGTGTTPIQSPFDNLATVDVESGALSFAAGVNFADGSQCVGPGPVFLSGGNFYLNGAISVANLVQTGGTLMHSNHTISGVFTWQSGDWATTGTTIIGSNALLHIVSGSDHNLPRHTLVNYGTVVWTGGHVRGGLEGTVIQNFGLWDCQTTYSINAAYGGNGLVFKNLGVFHKSVSGTTPVSGYFDNAGTVRVDTGEMSLSGGGLFEEGGRIAGPGLVRHTAATLTLQGLTRLESATFQFLDGTLAMAEGGAALETSDGGLFDWQRGWLSGVLTLTPGTQTRLSTGNNKSMADHAELHNYGFVSWENGALYGNCGRGPATIYNHAPGRFALTSSSPVLSRYSGNYEAVFINEGAFAPGTPGGQVNAYGWRFTQNPGGVFELALGGPTAVSDFGRWIGTYPAAIGGTLRAALANGFAPAAGQTFTFLSAGAVSGAFGSQQLPALAEGLAWTLDGWGSSLTLRVTPAATCVPPGNGLSAWFAGEDSPLDAAGLRQAQLINGATFAYGQVGRCFRLDGINDYVDIGPLAELNGASEITVMAWVRRANGNYSVAGIVGKWDTTPWTQNDQFLLSLGEGGDSGKCAFAVAFDNNEGGSFTGTNYLPVGEWVHLAAVWRSSDGFTGLYKNGVLENSSTLGVGRVLKSHNAYTAKIGEWGVVRDSYHKFPGDIDEVMLYTRALDAAEIAGLVNAGFAGACRTNPACLQPPAGLAGWWTGDGTAQDSASTNHGTLAAGASFEAGLAGQAFRLDGAGGSLSVLDHPSLRPGALTLSAWISTQDPQATQPVLAKVEASGNWVSYMLRVESGQVALMVENKAAGDQFGHWLATPALEPNRWYHVAATWGPGHGDRTDAHVYLNGLEQATTFTGQSYGPGFTPGYSAQPLLIGRDEEPSGFFKGLVDEIAIYNRPLDSNEIAALFASRTAGLCRPGAGDTNAPPPARLPDLAVHSVSTPAAIPMGQTLTLVVTLTNLGADTAVGPWVNQFLLAQDAQGSGVQVLGAASFVGLLAPSYSITLTQAVSLPAGVFGPRYLGVMADSAADLAELNETNNTRFSKIATAIVVPDLAVVDVSAPDLTHPGSPVTLSWAVTNQGSLGLTNAAWTERVSLANANGPVTTVAEFAFTNSLASGEWLGRTQQLTLPASLAVGNYQWVIAADAQGNIAEPDESNNTLTRPVFLAYPDQSALFVNVHGGSYDGDGANFYQTLVVAGARATWVDLDANGKVAALLQAGPYDQVWVFDLSSGSDAYPADWQAIGDWFNARAKKNLICDGRAISSYWSGRWETEGRRLTQNYYENLIGAGGGLVLATDDSDYQAGINSINARIGIQPFSGNFSLAFIPVDVGSPLMSFPNALGDQLYDDSTPGQTSFGLQPNGMILYSVAWHSGNTNTPGISSSIRGQVGFRVLIASPANGSQFPEEAPVSMQATPQNGSAPFNFDWTSDRDGALGTGGLLVLSNLSPGTHRLTVVATDAVGAADSASVRITVLFVPPAVALALQPGSDSGQSSNDRITTNTTPAIDLTINKRGRLEVDLTGDAVPDQVLTDLAAGTYVVTAPALAPGAHAVLARFVPVRGDPVTNSLSIILDTQGPRILALTPAPGSLLNQPLSQVEVTFDSPMDAGTFTPADATLLAPGGAVAPMGVSALASNRFRVSFPLQRFNGACTLTVGPRIADVAGNFMDQNADGANGLALLDEFSAQFNLALPDLAITVLNVPTNAVAGQPVAVWWTLTNQGAALAVGPWSNRLVLANPWDPPYSSALWHVADLATTNSLLPGAFLTQTSLVIVPTGPLGAQFFTLRTDAADRVPEAHETNNDFTAEHRTYILAPDLEVSLLTSAATAQFGQALPVTWAVRNAGTADAGGAWSDRLYWSSQSNSLTGAMTLLTIPALAPLVPGAGYTNTQSVMLPLTSGSTPGTYYLIAAADPFHAQSESDEQNNLRSRAITVSLPPLPDLLVAHVSAPLAVLPGQAVEVVWTITNSGAAAATGSWRERLSTSNALQGLRALAESVWTNSLEPGGSVVRTQQIALPLETLAGPLGFFVHADSRDEVIEEDEANNLGASEGASTVPARLTLAVGSLQMLEGAPAVSATVSHNSDRSQPLTVTLANGDPTELDLPNQVVIPANQAAASFSLRALPDGLVDGPQTLTIGATALGYVSASAQVVVLDADMPKLALTLGADTVAEGQFIDATLTRDYGTNAPLEVALLSSNPARLSAPASLTIPEGAWGRSFRLEARDDNQVLGPLAVTVRAAASGFSAAAANLTVLDDDVANVVVTVANPTMSESAGPQATVGTVTREPVGDWVLVVDLVSSDTSEVLVPPRVIIPAGRASASFLVAAVDDADLDGPQSVTITPWITASGSGTRLASGWPAILTVTDDESPALRVLLAKKLVAEGLPRATTATVSRNTSAGLPLVVTLSSSDLGEATVPPSVTIPQGAGSASFTISSVSDATPDGSQSVTITASAAGYASGAETLVVSDTDLPDLVVENLTAPANLEAEAYFDVSYRVVNQGLASAGSNWLTRVLLSRDPLVGEDALLGAYAFAGSVPAGQSYSQTVRVRAPQAVGQYWIIVSTDAENAVAETLEDNNTAMALTPVAVQAPYQVTVETDVNTALAGTPVPLRGRAFGANNVPASFVLVNLHVTLRGAKRICSAVTDQDGRYTATFQPNLNEAGRYSVGAAHPGVTDAAVQDTFDLLGFQASPPWVAVTVAELATVTGAVNLENLGELPLSGLSASVLDQPANLSTILNVSHDGALPGGASIGLNYSITAENASIPGGLVNVRVTSAEGPSVTVPFSVTVEPLRARLVVSPATLKAGMVRGCQRMIAFEVVNQGAIPTEPITVSLPAVAWLQLASTNPLPSLAPGATNHVSLLLSPAADQPLGPHTGGLALSCPSAGVGLPYEFRCVSEDRGHLLVSTVDEYTFYAEGAPRLTNTTVSLTDALTQVPLGSWPTDAQGELLLTNLLESYYTLEVSAPDHTSYRATIYLEPGQTNTVEAYLPRQAVRYTWTVVPTEVEDRTRIVLETDFETFVPMPVVTLTPKLVDLTDVTNDVIQIDFTIENHGLIAAQDTEFKMEGLKGWRFTPLLTWIGELPAMTAITVPVIAERVTPAHARMGGAGLAPAGLEGEDCNSLTWAIYAVVCRQYKSARADIAQLFDRSKCPPAPIQPGPANLSALVQGMASLFGGSRAYYGPPVRWDPPPQGGKPGVAFANVLPEKPPTTVPWYCNPCTWKIGSVLFGCVKDTLLDMVNPVPGVAQCIQNSADAVINGTTALDAIGAVEGCLSELGKSVPGLGNVIKALQCGRDLLNACKTTKTKSSAFELLPGEPATLALVNAQIERLTAFLGAWQSFIGDEAWFHPAQGTNFVLWMEEFRARTTTNSADGALLSPAERAELFALPWPEGLAETHLSKFLDRWNRTVEYYAQGVVNLADVPTGWSTDFIARNVLTNAFAGTLRAIDESVADGYTDPFEALQAAVAQVEIELGAKPAQGVCGRITLRLDQQAVISRDAFKATLEIVNETSALLSNVSVEVMVLNAAGQVVTERFGIREPALANLNAVDGTGSIWAGTTARATWTLIPTSDAAPTTPTEYYVSGLLRYHQEGVQITVPLTAVAITVHPNPRLHVKYFHQRDVFADDPFTDTVEPSIPFSLAVMVENRGFGQARNLRITSAQPEIIENEKGLLIDFRILASEVEGQALTPSLTVNLGNVGAHQTKIGRWLLTSTLQGLFTGYRATFEHLDALGNTKLSLIEEVTIHELIHLVQAPAPFEDGRPDFLVNGVPDPDDVPDTLYLSDGSTNAVAAVRQATVDAPPSPGHLAVTLTALTPGAWVYLRVPDPGDGQYLLRHVRRSDGPEISPGTNTWTTDRTFIGLGRKPIRENLLHLLDFNSTGSYVLQYEPLPVPDTNAPASSVAALPAHSYEQFSLDWSGADEPSGAGLAFYDIFVSTDGAPFIPWLQRTTLRNATFQGQLGQRYAFYSIATDTAGNRQPAPLQPDAQTLVDVTNSPPVVTAAATVVLDEGQTLQYQVAASDVDATQSLRFGLAPGAPPGVWLDPATGLLSWWTGETTGPSTNVLRVVVADSGQPSLSAASLVTVVVNEVNSPPTLSSAPPQVIRELQRLGLQFSASDADLPPQRLTFSLGSGAPAGANINPFSGAFSWTPTGAQGPSTNLIAVIVTDDGAPALSATQSLTVVVRDTSPEFSVGLGRTNVLAGETNSVPVWLNSGLELTHLQFQVDVPPEHLGGLALQGAAGEVLSSVLSPLGPRASAVEFTLDPARVGTGLHALAQLRFVAATNGPSAVAPLVLSELAGTQANHAPVLKTAATDGSVIIVAREPVLVAATDGRLTLYGLPGHQYAVEYTYDLTPGAPWQESARFTLSGRSVDLATGQVSQPIFFRAKEVNP